LIINQGNALKISTIEDVAAEKSYQMNHFK